MHVIETAPLDYAVLKLAGAEYRIEFPMSAVITAEKGTGLQLKSLKDWVNVPYLHLPVILFHGLQKHQPDVTLELATNVCETLNLEKLSQLISLLCELNFPESMRRVIEHWGKGAISPNAQSVDGR